MNQGKGAPNPMNKILIHLYADRLRSDGVAAQWARIFTQSFLVGRKNDIIDEVSQFRLGQGNPLELPAQVFEFAELFLEG